MAKRRSVFVSLGLGAVLFGSVGLALAQTRAPAIPIGGAPGAHTSMPAPAPAPTNANLIAVAPPNKPPRTPPLRPTSGGGAYSALTAETKTGIVNGARAKFGLAPLSEATAVALAGGVLVTPAAPVSGNNALSFRWEPFVAAGYAELHGAAYVFSPVPDNKDDVSFDRVVDVDLETVVNRLYVAECAYASAQPLTITFYLQSGRTDPAGFEGPAVTPIDPKTNRALFAFKARNVFSRLHVLAYRSAGASPPAGGVPNTMTFTGCSLIPAAQ